MADWQSIGKHATRVETDIVHVVWNGEVGLAETKEIFALYAAVQDREGRLFALSDMRKSGVPGAEVRRWIANWMTSRPAINGAAAYGANVMVRAAFMMLMRGIMLIGKFRFPFDMFATETEALAWIARLRHDLSGQGAH